MGIPEIVSINTSPGGIPKHPVAEVFATVDGIVGDGRAHAKHLKPGRAVSLLDAEMIETIRGEDYAVGPGVMGENLTTRGVDLLSLAPGTRLRLAGGVEIELTEPRAPCFVLDAIHPDLKHAVRDRFGWMARVVTPGVLRVGDRLKNSSQLIAPGTPKRHSSEDSPVGCELTGAVLAGGMSRRMGRPKEGVILWDGRPMIEHVIESLVALCRRVVIVGACSGFRVEPGRGIIRLADRSSGQGPLAGIETLLASGLDSGYLIVACDQPRVTPHRLRPLLNDGDPAVPRFFRAQDGSKLDPFPGYFPAAWLPMVRDALARDHRSVRALIRRTQVTWVSISDVLRADLRSVNTPADLAGLIEPRHA
ncbi:MAG: NTP transferase domain-containing protein [Nitrospirae bacterium]|nr:NTP transferase domain-containing protein [Nitrospirota bacterium]